MALFRYEMILPAINGFFVETSVNKYFESVSRREVSFPDGTTATIGVSTLRMWLRNYRKDGFDGLKDKQRKDNGKHRSLNSTQKQEIYTLKEQRPKRTAVGIYNTLIKQGLINQSETSLSTVQRYIASIKPVIGAMTHEDMRAFEMEYVNDLWQIDTSHGPYLTINGEKLKTYIIAIVDDASRLIVGHGIFYNDNSINVQTVLKQAIEVYGVPKRLYTDNGTPYRNNQLTLICAQLGIGLKRAQVYHGNQKGKVERTFKSIKEGWMYDIDYKDFGSPEELNTSLAVYTREKNQTDHRSLDDTPWNRFEKDKEYIVYLKQDVINNAFLHSAKRKVAKDSTISLEKIIYEVPQGYMERNILIKYQHDLSEVFLIDGSDKIKIFEVDKVSNSKIRRNQPLLSDMEEQ